MKFAVHWAPSVNVWTPGWTVAVAAGAQADAADGTMASAASAAAAARSRRCMGLASWFGVRRLERSLPSELAVAAQPEAPGRLPTMPPAGDDRARTGRQRAVADHGREPRVPHPDPA